MLNKQNAKLRIKFALEERPKFVVDRISIAIEEIWMINKIFNYYIIL